MIKKNKRQEKVVDRHRWLISYADFITLLFAFFVVMYSMSVVNHGKFRVMADSLEVSFQNPIKSISFFQFGHPSRLTSEYLPNASELPVNTTVNNRDAKHEFSQELPLNYAKELVNKIAGGLINDGKVKVTDASDWSEIEISSSMLFGSGAVNLTDRAITFISDLSYHLNKINNSITIEGFTDNIPLDNAAYESNLDLSAQRAAKVANELVQLGINKDRISVVGYGESFPIAKNSTVTGRDKNRRVIIVIDKKNHRKSYLKRNMVVDHALKLQYQTDKDQQQEIKIKDEIIIQPKKIEGNKVKGILQPDGSIKFNSFGVFEEKDSPEQHPGVNNNISDDVSNETKKDSKDIKDSKDSKDNRNNRDNKGQGAENANMDNS